jgi:hypothetical protein
MDFGQRVEALYRKIIQREIKQDRLRQVYSFQQGQRKNLSI